MWDTVNDAQMRIGGCVIKYRDDFWKVMEVDWKAMDVDRGHRGVGLTLVNIETKEVASVGVDDKEISYKPLRTGYCNLRDRVSYVQRVPVRRWKHGLHINNLECDEARKEAFMSTKAFSAMLRGDYPSFEKAIGLVENRKAIAFHRLYALERGNLGLVWLAYRGYRVGWLERDAIRLGDDYKFLREELDEVIYGT